MSKKKIMKVRLDWHEKNHVKKIRIVMILIAVAIVISVIICGVLIWSQLKPVFGLNDENGAASKNVSSSEVNSGASS